MGTRALRTIDTAERRARLAIGLEDVGAEAATAAEAAADRIATWLGTVRVTPRFRTPLEKELSL